jgi:hypothetical protein
MNSRVEKINGLSRVLRPDQRVVRARKDATGGIRLIIDSEEAVLSPEKAFQLATAMLEALGYAFEKKAIDLQS